MSRIYWYIPFVGLILVSLYFICFRLNHPHLTDMEALLANPLAIALAILFTVTILLIPKEK